MSTTSTTLGFIGAGNMGFALLNGFSIATSSPKSEKDVKISVYDADPDKRESLMTGGFNVAANELEIARNCKYIVLACKPQQLTELLLKIKSVVTSETVLISLCAGISAEYIRGVTGSNSKVVLVMPNMPVTLGTGATALACDGAVTAEEFAFVRGIAESCGIAEVIPVDKMNEIICINASSPAFIYLFSQGFAEYAAGQGIDQKAALNLFAQTLIGAGKMLMQSGATPDELIQQVASKGGTTQAGLDALTSGGLREIIRKVCEACTKRAYELGKSS
ncbi:MAG: pyrroline-5-carboxylate reductase [Oscillospiraceae bacterium]|nr:pyrroline-5-carboxylate reductase [Oscillospiraceae bacterium]